MFRTFNARACINSLPQGLNISLKLAAETLCPGYENGVINIKRCIKELIKTKYLKEGRTVRCDEAPEIYLSKFGFEILSGRFGGVNPDARIDSFRKAYLEIEEERRARLRDTRIKLEAYKVAEAEALAEAEETDAVEEAPAPVQEADSEPMITIMKYNNKSIRTLIKLNIIWFVLTDIADKLLKLGSTAGFFNTLDEKEHDYISLTNKVGNPYPARIISKTGMLKLLDERKNKKGAVDVYKWIAGGMQPPEREDNLSPPFDISEQRAPEREDNLPPFDISEQNVQDVSSEVITMDFKDKSIRVIMKDGKPWFVANDVCRILEYQNVNKAINDNCKGYNHWLYPLKTAGGVQRMLILNEANLYRLIMQSKMPAAVEFQDWVVEEVLPTIRRTGAYITDSKTAELKQAPEKGLELLAQVEQTKAELAAPIINLGPFLKKSCVYLFKFVIDTVEYVKPGYTADIIVRIKSLRETFGAEPQLLCIRPASAENSEKEFHKLLKARYPELYPKKKINEKLKSELYLYDKRIIEEFNMYEFESPSNVAPPAIMSQTLNDTDEIRKLELQVQLELAIAEKLRLENFKLEFEIMKWKKANGIPL